MLRSIGKCGVILSVVFFALSCATILNGMHRDRTIVVEGLVSDVDGTPLAGKTVIAYDTRARGMIPQFTPSIEVHRVVSGEDGRFTVEINSTGVQVLVTLDYEECERSVTRSELAFDLTELEQDRFAADLVCHIVSSPGRQRGQ